MRPFTRDNDGRDEVDRLKEPSVENFPNLVADHGAFYDVTGAPLVAHHLQTGRTPGLRGELATGEEALPSIEAAPASGPQTMATANPYAVDPGVVPADELASGDISGPVIENVPRGGAGGTTIIRTGGGYSACAKSDCVLWGVIGLFLGLVLGKDG